MNENVNNSYKNNISSKGLDFIIFGAITLIFFLSPLFFTGTIAQGLGFEKIMIFYVLTLIAVVAWVTKGVVLGELNFKKTPLDIPIAITLVIFSISTALSISPLDSFIGNYGSSAKSLISAFAFALFYYLVVNNIDVAKVKIIVSTFLASSSLIIIYTAFQLNAKYLLPFEFTKNISFNPMGSLSSLTAFLVIIFPVFIVFASKIESIFPNIRKEIKIIIKSILLLVMLASIYVLFVLQGFTSWLIAVVAMAIILLFLLSKIIKINNNNLIIPLLGFLVTIIFLILGNVSFGNRELPAEVSISRDASWAIAKNSLKENPVFGSGPSTFYYSFSKFKGENFNNSPLWNVRFDSPTGALFELLTSVGVVGALSVVVLALTAFSIIFLSLIKNNNKEIDSVLLGFLASFVASALFSLLFTQNNSLILMIILIAVLAISIAVNINPDHFKILKLSFRASAKYALALSAIFLSVSAGVVILCTLGFKMYLADVYAKEAILDADIAKKIEKLEKAKNLFPYADAYHLNLANAYMAQANNLAINKEDNEKIANALSLAISSGKEAIALSPSKVANNESLALIYENASFYTRDALEHAEGYYNKIIELDPNNPTPYLRIALINMARANNQEADEEKKYNIEQAVENYDKAIAKKGDLAAAYYGKAIAQEKLGKIDEAIEELKKASMHSSDNLDYRFELGRLLFNKGISQSVLGQANTNSGASSTLSVEGNINNKEVVEANSDLLASEQLFLNIINNNPKHANARYSLAVLYQKIGKNEEAKTQVNELLDIVEDNETREAVKTQFSGLLE